jgi:predicted RNase H-like nuclease
VARICGTDGCREGWIGIIEDLETGALTWQVSPTLESLASSTVADLIALDIPIGLPDRGARDCDLAARRLLGPGRGSSVFPAPIRPLLEACSHAEACSIRETVEHKRLSIQSWAIIPKIREVDAALRASAQLRARVREVHPEVCFYYLASRRPMSHAKKKREGRERRVEAGEAVTIPATPPRDRHGLPMEMVA